jgi:hypothetical protein
MRRMQTVGAKSGATQTSKTVPSPAEWQTEYLAGASVHCYLEGTVQKSGAVAHTNGVARSSSIMGKPGRARLRRAFVQPLERSLFRVAPISDYENLEMPPGAGATGR